MEIEKGTLVVVLNTPDDTGGYTPPAPPDRLGIVVVPREDEARRDTVVTCKGATFVSRENLVPLAHGLPVTRETHRTLEQSLRGKLPEVIVGLVKYMHELEKRVKELESRPTPRAITRL